jgi:hypothetical protein
MKKVTTTSHQNKKVSAKKAVPLELSEAKAILTEMLTMDGAFYTSDLTHVIQTLAGLDRKTARIWGVELAAHIEKVDAEDKAGFEQMRRRIEKAETVRLAQAGQVRAAYEQLAEGVSAVLTLESTDAHTCDLLTGLAHEIWNNSANRDSAGAARWQLRHAGEWKSHHAG